MTRPNRGDAARPSCSALQLEGGRTITSPSYPQDCDWIAVLVDGTEIHRSAAPILAADPISELTRLAEALCPGRPAAAALPAGDDGVDRGEQCGVRVTKSGRTLRFAAAPEPVKEMSVCDAAGNEIGYWPGEEFAEDAVEVLGAAIGALESTRERP